MSDYLVYILVFSAGGIIFHLLNKFVLTFLYFFQEDDFTKEVVSILANARKEASVVFEGVEGLNERELEEFEEMLEELIGRSVGILVSAKTLFGKDTGLNFLRYFTHVRFEVLELLDTIKKNED